MMNNLKPNIRPAEVGDAQRIAELSHQLGYGASIEDIRSRLSKIGNSGDTAAFVSEQDSFVTGWIQVSMRISIESGDTAEIIGLVVDEVTRGRGTGAALVRRAELWARDKGFDRIRVRTNVTRSGAREFYIRLSFDEIKKQIVFTKPIAPNAS